MDNYQSIGQMSWSGHSPISSMYHQQQQQQQAQQQTIQDYKSENNSIYGSPYTPIIHSPDISPVASPEPDGKFHSLTLSFFLFAWLSFSLSCGILQQCLWANDIWTMEYHRHVYAYLCVRYKRWFNIVRVLIRISLISFSIDHYLTITIKI